MHYMCATNFVGTCTLFVSLCDMYNDIYLPLYCSHLCPWKMTTFMPMKFVKLIWPCLLVFLQQITCNADFFTTYKNPSAVRSIFVTYNISYKFCLNLLNFIKQHYLAIILCARKYLGSRRCKFLAISYFVPSFEFCATQFECDEDD